MDIAKDAVERVKILTDKSFYNPLKCDLSAFKCKPVTYYIVAMVVILTFLFIAYATKSSRTVLLVSTACHLLIFIMCSLILINLCNSSNEYYSYAVIVASAIMTGLIVFIFNMRKKTVAQQISVVAPTVPTVASSPVVTPTTVPVVVPVTTPVAPSVTVPVNVPTKV